MAENSTPEEKPLTQKTKVLYTFLVLVLIVGTLLPLAILGKVTVTSEQIFTFGEFTLGFLITGHALQRGTGYIAQAIGRRATPVATPETNPEPPAN